MKSKGILMNTEMVKAILAGTKTVTRRLIKPQPPSDSAYPRYIKDEIARFGWEAVTKYHRTEPIMCNFDVGAIILGRVVDIKNFPQGVAVFVQVNDQKELDVLCGMPAEMEIEKNVSVIIKITSINYPEDELEKPRLRGYIMRVA